MAIRLSISLEGRISLPAASALASALNAVARSLLRKLRTVCFCGPSHRQSCKAQTINRKHSANNTAVSFDAFLAARLDDIGE